MARSFRARALFPLALAALAAASGSGAEKPGTPAQPTKPAFEGKVFEALGWRSIGPLRGGRVTAVSGVAGQPLAYYMGATGDGVWKTTNGGIEWTPIAGPGEDRLGRRDRGGALRLFISM